MPFGKAEGRQIRVGKHAPEHAYSGKQGMVLGVSMSASQLGSNGLAVMCQHCVLLALAVPPFGAFENALFPSYAMQT